MMPWMSESRETRLTGAAELGDKSPPPGRFTSRTCPSGSRLRLMGVRPLLGMCIITHRAAMMTNKDYKTVSELSGVHRDYCISNGKPC